ncbi:MAG TPA: class I tRNA ligase family protein, partial [Actinomycetota bacterium]|nr:class I tRNA ligase family protein [Actinomycetota bacterium]
PFRNVLIHGIVRDFEGKKMSKSVGNVIDPLDIIDRHGADALRFSLAFAAIPGNDTNASEDRIEGARNFANKLWNAARFVLLSIGEERPALPTETDLNTEDRWILSCLDSTIEDVEESLHHFNWAEALKSLHRFIWSEFCDWYIELSKLRLGGDQESAVSGVLVHVLDRILRLLHPVMPFVTEELWSRLRPDEGSIMVAPWPQTEGRADATAEATMRRFQDLVSGIRRLRAEHGIDAAKRIKVTVAAKGYTDEISELQDALLSLARLEEVELVDQLAAGSDQVTTITPEGIEASVRLGDVIDLEVERQRLTKRISELDKEVSRAEGKLSNKEFVSKAPPPVVEKEKGKLSEALAAREKLEAQLKDLD